MKLIKLLQEQGYDLIGGPIRNHKPLQLWVKKTFDEIELYYASIYHAFKSEVVLEEIENTSLIVNSSHQDNFGFNIGITLAENILKSIGLGVIDLSGKIKSGKTVSISYDDSHTREVTIGNLENYLSSADFIHVNPLLLQNANRNNIVIVTGIVFAKKLVVNIETDYLLGSDFVNRLNMFADGRLEFTVNGKNKLRMVTSGNSYFSIAVKASRIDFEEKKFKKLTLITDNRNWF